MNNTCLSLLLLLAGLPGNSQATIGGYITGSKDWKPMLYLSSLNTYTDLLSRDEIPVFDSARLAPDGRFVFKSPGLHSGIYRLHLQPAAGAATSRISLGTPYENYLHLYVAGDTDTITITANGTALNRGYQVQGNTECALFQQIRDLRLPLFRAADSCWALLDRTPPSVENDDPALRSTILQTMQHATQQVQQALRAFLDSTANPNAGLLAAAYYNLSAGPEPGNACFDTLADKWRRLDAGNPYLQSFIAGLDDDKNYLPIGALAPDIALPDQNSHATYLSEIPAKLILVDFWASGCCRCRARNNTLLKPLYHRYREEGLQVFSVAFDTCREKWRRAIQEDRLDWIQIADFGGTALTGIAAEYKVKTLPTTYLLDANGRVLARNPGARELEEIVRTYLESN